MKSSSRNGARVRLLAVHTTEGIMRAGDLRAFFDRPTAAGSSHAGADDTGALLGPESGYVPHDRASWTLRNGNPVSDNLELCAWARYTGADWLARPRLLQACARWLADRSQARGIPLVKLTPSQVKAGQAGVIGHHDWTVGMKDGTHWDPGPAFPWDVVIGQARALVAEQPTPSTGDDDMPQFALIRNRDDGQMVLAAPGTTWYPLPGPAYVTLAIARGLCPSVATDVVAGEFGWMRDHVYAVPQRMAAGRDGLPSFTEEEALAELEALGQPVLTEEQIVGAGNR